MLRDRMRGSRGPGPNMVSLPAPQLKPWLMRLVAMLLPFCLVLLLEGVSRVGAYVWHDFSEYYLFYGFHSYAGRVGISPWWTDTGRHYKFPPGYQLRNASGQGGETATINARGFRGSDFDPAKPRGTFRIVCLGESSTFGFHNGDTETFPYLLEKALRERPQSARAEVINAGFPYYNTGSILSLLQSEVIGYEPDVIILYSAYNDASWPLHVGAISRLASWFQEHSILYLLTKEHVLDERELLKWKGRFVRLVLRQAGTQEAFRTQTPQIVARYRKNVEAIIAIAKAHGVDLVDNVAVLDKDRRLMASYVHLTAEANLRLAEALRPVVERYLPGPARQ
jgi:lysophospholipase L1-like esterase